MVWFSRSAALGNQYAQFFLERQNDLRPPSVMLTVTNLLYHMSRIFEDHSLPRSSAGLQVDRKLRRKIQEKKIAMGHKPDDHEEAQSQAEWSWRNVTYPLKNYGAVNNRKAFGVGKPGEMITI